MVNDPDVEFGCSWNPIHFLASSPPSALKAITADPYLVQNEEASDQVMPEGN